MVRFRALGAAHYTASYIMTHTADLIRRVGSAQRIGEEFIRVVIPLVIIFIPNHCFLRDFLTPRTWRPISRAGCRRSLTSHH